MTTVHVLLKETRYDAAHQSNRKHYDPEIISVTDTVPANLPRLNVWLDCAAVSEFRYIQIKYTLHAVKLNSL